MKKYVWGLIVVLVLSCVLARVSFAQDSQYSIKTMTPQIKQALENRRDRFDELEDWKAKGVIGENNNGYVALLQDNAEAERLAIEENADRKIIYEAIVEQNNLGPDSLNIVEKVFARVQREKAEAGHKIQKESAAWITKE